MPQDKTTRRKFLKGAGTAEHLIATGNRKDAGAAYKHILKNTPSEAVKAAAEKGLEATSKA
jgi:hypothetical protein